ncbi:hypothetical protein [Paenibacillus sp. MBLB4367]|uniref:GAP1-N2 domain-containing protein n=1 Tax=Paenibacillus sp. MBLB4367 TaxID=3384767 RepID=UPI00390806D6
MANIQQHYYTREREGLFRSNAGYDSIAKSPGLDGGFIKRVLHPYCGYDAPKELTDRNESDLGKYPESYTVFHADSGETVLGSSVFAGADFTGQRNTFFAHHLIVPGERAEGLVTEPSAVFHAAGFQRRHDIGEGKALPELADIPTEHVPYAAVLDTVRNKLGIGADMFKRLLYAVMMSVSSKKKVYITLDTGVSESSAYAKRLMEALYRCLPYAVRRRLGFTTYSYEPVRKDHLHVVFVEKGNIRPSDRNIEKDYLFDFANNRFANTDLQGDEHEYLNFAWDNLQTPERMIPFFEFAEEVLAPADKAKELAVSTYYELCALYQIEAGDYTIYERNKAGVLHGIYGYLLSYGIERETRLNRLFVQLFDRERETITSRNLPPLEAVKLVIDYYRIAEESKQLPFIVFLILVANAGKSAQQSDYVAEVYKALAANPPLFIAFFNQVFVQYGAQLAKPLFEEYLEERVKNLSKHKDVLKELGFWLNHTPHALGNVFFRDKFAMKLPELLEHDKKYVASALEIHRFLDTFAIEKPFADAYEKFREDVLSEVDHCLLWKLDFKTLNEEDYASVIRIMKERRKTFRESLDERGRHHYDALRALDAMMTDTKAKAPDQYMDDLPLDMVQPVQHLLKAFQMGKPGGIDFDRLLFAFYRPQKQRERSAQAGGDFIDYGALLQAVYAEKNEAGVYALVFWMLQKGKLPRTFIAELKKHFVETDRESLKDKQLRRKWKRLGNAGVDEVLEYADEKTASGFKKLYKRNKMLFRRLFVLGGGSIILLAMLGGGGWLVYDKLIAKPDNEPANSPAPSLSPSPSGEPSSPAPSITPSAVPSGSQSGAPGSGPAATPGTSPGASPGAPTYGPTLAPAGAAKGSSAVSAGTASQANRTPEAKR